MSFSIFLSFTSDNTSILTGFFYRMASIMSQTVITGVLISCIGGLILILLTVIGYFGKQVLQSIERRIIDNTASNNKQWLKISSLEENQKRTDKKISSIETKVDAILDFGYQPNFKRNKFKAKH